MNKKGGNILFSNFLSTSFKKDKIAIFHRLHPEIIYLQKKEWNNLFVSNKSSNREIIKKLINQKLIVDTLQEDKKEIKNLQNKMNYELNTLYLVLTRSCNFKCSYCPFSCSSKNSKSEDRMSIATVKKGIDFWQKLIGKYDVLKQYTIILYGGEPFLNVKTLEWALSYIEKLKQLGKLPKKNLQVMADTNGSLLNEEIIKMLKKYNVAVTVALDGIAKFNDRYRLSNKKRGTFDDVFKNIVLLKKHKVLTYVSMMAIPYEWNKKSIIDFCNFLAKYDIKKLGINLLRGEQSDFIKQFFPDDPILKYQKWATKFMIDFWKLAQKIGILEYQIDKKKNLFMSKRPLSLDCGAFGNHVVVQPNGEIGSCPWSQEYNIGNVDDNLVDLKNKLNIPKVKYKNLIPVYNPECLKCEAISICGGKCIWDYDKKRKFSKQNIYKNNEQCIFTKKVFNYFVWNYPNVLKNINVKK